LLEIIKISFKPEQIISFKKGTLTKAELGGREQWGKYCYFALFR